MAAGDVTVQGHSGRAIRGKRQVWGTVVLDGANPTPINLSAYLRSIEAFQLTHQATATPGDDPTYLTGGISGTTLNVYAWKNTGGTDPTLVASTDNDDVVQFWAVGIP